MQLRHVDSLPSLLIFCPETMAQDDDYIGFKITQRDLDDEFNINRSSKRQSKNQSIYGVWADSDSDDDSKVQAKKSDYSAPIGFVKGGFKDDDESKSAKQEEKVPKKTNNKKPQSTGFAGIRNASRSSDPSFAQWEVYTKGIGSKLLQKMGYQPGKGLGKNQQGITAPVEAKKRPGFGAIGAYGPEGKPPPLSKPEDEKEEISDEESGGQAWKKGQNQKPKIKKVKVYTKSHDEIIAENLFNSWNKTDDDNGPRMKIIDMTGREQRILSGLSQLHTSRAQKPKDDYHPTQMNSYFDVPELKQNLERLIRLSENKIYKGRQDYERDLKHIEGLVHEKAHLENQISEEEWQLKQLDLYDSFVEGLEYISDHVEQDDAALNAELELILTKFESFYTADFKRTFNRLLGLDDLLQCTFGPRLRKELLFWKPFSSDDRVLSLFKRLKGVVCRQRTFDILLWDYWNPVVCRALQQWPSMQQYEPIIHFLEQWFPVIPKWLYEYLIGSHLLPKLNRETELWEPSKDPVPIHQWILPWPKVLIDTDVSPADIEFLFEPIYEVIRQKLAKALASWKATPEDHSVLKMIALWKDAFSETSYQNFIEQNIVPKLEVMMRAVRVNPQAQSFAEWNWVMTWRPMITTNTMVSLLEKCFFPNWLFTLHNWLSQPMFSFAEINAWYREWKDHISDLSTNATIKELFNKALLMIHHAVDENLVLQRFTEYYSPQAPRVMPESVAPTLQQPQPYVHSQMSAESMTYTQVDSISFKQMVELKANENGVLFMPLNNRFQAGKQVFQFGQFLVYIDNQVLFIQKFINANRVWAPIAIQELIDMCRV